MMVEDQLRAYADYVREHSRNQENGMHTCRINEGQGLNYPVGMDMINAPYLGDDILRLSDITWNRKGNMCV
jgi:hypothetical protein